MAIHQHQLLIFVFLMKELVQLVLQIMVWFLTDFHPILMYVHHHHINHFLLSTKSQKPLTTFLQAACFRP